MNCVVFLIGLLILSPAWAGDMPSPGPTPDLGAAPLTIDAGGTLEMHRDQHQYIATGGVVVTQGTDKLTADHVVADYTDVDGSLQITRITATGQAVATQKTDTIAADQIVALIDKDSTGARVMTQATATGNVVITTPTERATGTKGVYTRADNSAILEGPVTITRGPNILNGARAKVNLTTHVSTIFGDTSHKTRVRGVFYPEKKK